jgi:uncharacterized repeat protein (TIGR03803 family)
MRHITFGIAAVCTLATLGFLATSSSGASATSAASIEKVVHSFTGAPDGATPMSDLTLDAEGSLYGTTQFGGSGTCDCGTVFEVRRTQDGWKEEVLYSFKGGDDGSMPIGSVIFDAAGNLYGTTSGGGTSALGTVFELTPTSSGKWKEAILYSFTGRGNGSNPRTDLLLDGAGNLFGTTAYGGAPCPPNGCGVVFELTRETIGSWTETTIHEFTGTPDGATPATPVILDSDGNLYGATKFGGTGSCGSHFTPIVGCGALYKLSPQSGGTWTETVIYNFVRGGGFGSLPSGGLFVDKNGDLFGTAFTGGFGYGSVFELRDSPGKGWLETDPQLFDGDIGLYPLGRLAVDANGDLFGVAYTVFEMLPLGNSWKARTVHVFQSRDSNDGTEPEAGPVLDSQGHLYGTTAQGGGIDNDGTVYEITP